MPARSKLTAKVQNELCAQLLAGHYLETAAAAVGIHRSTVYDWLDRGDREAAAGEDTPYAAFYLAVEQSRARAEIADLAIVKEADVNWQAAAWRLERRTPGRWGKRQEVAVTGKDGGPVEVKLSFDPQA